MGLIACRNKLVSKQRLSLQKRLHTKEIVSSELEEGTHFKKVVILANL